MVTRSVGSGFLRGATNRRLTNVDRRGNEAYARGSEMTSATDDAVLDAVLAVQLVVGWAGEGRCEPKRLGWWDTDVIDPAGGGDLMARLLPRTHAWASLEAAREAARRADAKARARMGDPDKLRTLFFFGFALDEALADRFSLLKREGRSPVEVLQLGLLQQRFSNDALVAAFKRPDAAFTVVSGGGGSSGRQLKGKCPDDVKEMVLRLAAGLVPLSEAYPLPFFKVGG